MSTTIELPFDQFTVGNIRKPRVVKGHVRLTDGLTHPVEVTLLPPAKGEPAKNASLGKKPAKKAASRKPARSSSAKTSAKTTSAKTKVLSRGVAKEIRRKNRKYAGMTPEQMIAAGLKGYHLPTGAVRSAIRNG